MTSLSRPDRTTKAKSSRSINDAGIFFEIAAERNCWYAEFWDDKIDVDVDLWVQGPNDQPVGYSAMSGKLFNLLRDDLGLYADTSGKNFEIAVSRGVLAGEYRINVMLYKDKRKGAKTFPLDVHVIVTMKRGPDDELETLFDKHVKLYKEQEEITVVDFKLDNRFQVISNSVNSLFKPLASGMTP